MPPIAYLKTDCEKCSGHIEYPTELAGQSIECPHCQQMTTLPSPFTPPPLPPINQKTNKEPIIVQIYRGSQESATVAFQTDASNMAKLGYYPISQSWAPGGYGCGSFIVALLLCIVLIGIIVFVYMLIVKPPGTLSVTYALRQP
jgi:hypothetical protein